MHADANPFAAAEFADNPEPRCPCLLLLDVSGSMAGGKIEELNAGLKAFEEELKSDSLSAKRVEVAIVTFGPVLVAQDFTSASQFQAPQLQAQGLTPMAASAQGAVPPERHHLLPSVDLPHHRRRTHRQLAAGCAGHFQWRSTQGIRLLCRGRGRRRHGPAAPAGRA